MNAEKIFTFKDRNFELKVRIPEVVDPQYGMFTWPSAPVLAQYLFVNRALVQGKTVVEVWTIMFRLLLLVFIIYCVMKAYSSSRIIKVEVQTFDIHDRQLGAGTALPGIVASLCGGNVILTDKEEYPECLANCAKSCHANNISSIQVIGITWGQFSPSMLRLPKADIILGSDCFYDPKDFEDILATVSYLIKKNPSGRFLSTYQERSSNWSIESLLSQWGLQCAAHISLASFNADGDIVGGHSMSSKHTIQMLEITKCEDYEHN